MYCRIQQGSFKIVFDFMCDEGVRVVGIIVEIRWLEFIAHVM